MSAPISAEPPKRLTDISTVKALCQKHHFSLSKGLGQNFIVNPGICPKIVDAAGIDGSFGVLEIGPGFGVLTRELARHAGKVVAVEVDPRLPPLLAETLAGLDNVTVIEGDAMRLELAPLLHAHFPGMRVAVCANLPYYITSPILMRLLEQRLPIEQITVMVQKEVADRFTAEPGDSDYGAVTASIGYYAKTEKLFSVSSGNFLPRPKVDSAVIRLTKISPPVSVRSRETLFRVIKSAFAMRRKTLVNNLKQEFYLSKDEGEAILEKLGFEKTVRGERLSLADYAKIADEIEKRKECEPA